MIKKKPITIFIAFAIVVTPLLSSFTTSYADFSQSSYNTSVIPEKHLIEGVPYVGQETDFYCAYASPTMVFRYYEINTTEHEVLFNSGVGYSFGIKGNTPIDGVHLSYLKADREFLADLYGLSYEDWKADINSMTADECWQEYWLRVKQNISQDIPVLTSANPFLLKSGKEFLKNPDWLSRFNITLPSSHMIVLVGYNESNGTVCYNDPMLLFFGHPEKGAYVWQNITEFSKAVKKALQAEYMIQIYKNTSANPLDKTEALERAHKRNIERMCGNKSAYDESCSGYLLGIKGLKDLRKDLGNIMCRLPTTITYKLKGTLYRVANKIFKIHCRILLLGDYIYMFACKYNMSKYLYEISNSSTYREEAKLLEMESENWSKLEYCVLKFGNTRLMQVLYPRIIIHKMTKTLDNIIAIEEKIISNSANNS